MEHAAESSEMEQRRGGRSGDESIGCRGGNDKGGEVRGQTQQEREGAVFCTLAREQSWERRGTPGWGGAGRSGGEWMSKSHGC